MAKEIQKSQSNIPIVNRSFKHSILDTWKFAEWVAYTYVRLNEV